MSLLRWIDRAEAACVVGAGMAGRDAAVLKLFDNVPLQTH
jgi:hypothetical protein